MKPEKIFIIGMPASGKTYWGQILAERLGFAFYDLDAAIEQKVGMRVAALFNTTSEQYFRTLEEATLLEIAGLPNSLVLSCGGGTPCFGNNLKHMQKAGQVICIHTDVETIYQRVLMEPEKRPLLAAADSFLAKEKLHKLLQERKDCYDKADAIVNNPQKVEDLLNVLQWV